MSKKTLKALIAREIDSKLANSLVQQNLTLSKLKSKTIDELIQLGINKDVAKNISKEQRPPIPEETVIKLLYKSKWTCCICRDRSKGVIIHHIKEWNISKDHSEENLVVLCPNHHDLAHTKKDLTLNLSESKLKEIKKEWLKEVRFQDTQTIRGLTIAEHTSGWDYFNHNRIFEIYLKKGISNENFRSTITALNKGWINNLGTYNLVDNNERHIYHFGEGYLMYFYMAELFDEVLKNTPLVDLTDKFNRSHINSLVEIGTYIGIQAGLYFKNLTKINEGRGQRRLCYYQKSKIRIQFEFDAYEATSISAWACHLAGHKSATVIGLVKSITYENDNMTITISCLAMGCNFKNHDYRREIYYS